MIRVAHHLLPFQMRLGRAFAALCGLFTSAGGDGACGVGGAVHVAPGESIADAVRASRRCTAHAVELGAGVHRLRAPLELGAEDSGLTLRGPARGAGGEAVVDGGVALAPFAARADGLWAAPLPPALFNASAANFPTALFVDGGARLRARAPNARGSAPWSYEDLFGDDSVFHGAQPLLPCSLPAFGTCPPEDATGFLGDATEPALRALLDALARGGAGALGADAWANVAQAWTLEWSRVAAINSSGAVQFREPAKTPVGAYGGARDTPSGGRWVLENARAALDAPGEFFVDADASELLYVPLAGEHPGAGGAAAVAPLLPTLLSVAGSAAAPAARISLQDLTLAHFAEPPGPAARLAGGPATAALRLGPFAEALSVLRVTVRDGAGHAVGLWPGLRGALIDRLNVSGVGGRGVTGMLMHGLPDLANSSGVVLSNSTVLRVGAVFVPAREQAIARIAARRAAGA
jgi:hypothetical protein